MTPQIEFEDKGRVLYAHVPYNLKEVVKSFGFLWDAKRKVWWISPTPQKLRTLEENFEVVIRPFQPYHPSPKRAELRDYQKLGVDFLHRTKYALLGDKAGLGKTAQVLVYAEEAGFSSVMVVCPASVLYNWEREVMKWTSVKEEDVAVITSATIPPDKRYYIISYDRFRRLNKTLPSSELLVVDESHYLKNPKALRTLAVVRYAETHSPKSIVLLSGTPFLNSPIELFPQLNLLYPSEFNNFFQFGIRYAGGRKGYWGWEFKKATNTEELKERMSSFFLGRTKQAVLKELPEVEQIYLPIKENLSKYREMKQEIKRMVDEGKDDLVIRANVFALRRLVGVIKVPQVLEIVENIGEKTVIFAVHKEVVLQLAEQLKCDFISGEVPPMKRQSLVDKFNQQSNGYLIITQAMQEGVNLQSAHHIVMAERLWNPAKEEQVYSRLHRFGQKHNVSVWIPILKDTLDERIHNMLIRKGEHYAKVFDIDKMRWQEMLDFV